MSFTTSSWTGAGYYMYNGFRWFSRDAYHICIPYPRFLPSCTTLVMYSILCYNSFRGRLVFCTVTLSSHFEVKSRGEATTALALRFNERVQSESMVSESVSESTLPRVHEPEPSNVGRSNDSYLNQTFRDSLHRLNAHLDRGYNSSTGIGTV